MWIFPSRVKHNFYSWCKHECAYCYCTHGWGFKCHIICISISVLSYYTLRIYSFSFSFMRYINNHNKTHIFKCIRWNFKNVNELAPHDFFPMSQTNKHDSYLSHEIPWRNTICNIPHEVNWVDIITSQSV